LDALEGSAGGQHIHIVVPSPDDLHTNRQASGAQPRWDRGGRVAGKIGKFAV
jgi:hypothetical protein